MFLINTETMELEEFPDERSVKYAILSHRWEKKEVSFRDMLHNPDVRKMSGYYKIRECSRLAAARGLRYAWVDTCCINKESSAELQEAINSMYRWYANSEVCFAFLSDCELNTADELENSKWFTRGWTLQELIAPSQLEFYDKSWNLIGPLQALIWRVSSITRIPFTLFSDSVRNLSDYSIAERMSWARNRETTRIEDRAYSLMGLFDVNMPMLYGEGKKAFMRLQEEILRTSNDLSILAWEFHKSSENAVFAESPDSFPSMSAQCASIYDFTPDRPRSVNKFSGELTVELYLTPIIPDVYLALLNCARITDLQRTGRIINMTTGELYEGIYIKRVNDRNCFMRIVNSSNNSLFRISMGEELRRGRIYQAVKITLVSKLIGEVEQYRWKSEAAAGFQIGINLQIVSNERSECTPADLQLIPPKKRLDGPVLYLTSSKNRYIDRIILGFDFDFYPVVVIRACHRHSSRRGRGASTDDIRFKQIEHITCMENEGWLTLDDDIEEEKPQSGDWHVWPFKLNGTGGRWGRFCCSFRVKASAKDRSPALIRFILQRPYATEPWYFTLEPDETNFPYHGLPIPQVSGYTCAKAPV